MKPASLRFSTALCTFLGLAAPLVSARQDDPQVARDMQFARALATRYAYVDYAGEVLTSLSERKLDSASSEALELLSCDVFAAGAGGAGSYEERVDLLKQALGSYKKFLSDYPRSIQLSRAQSSYVGVVNLYGRLLESRIEDTIGDEASALRQELVEELEAGLELTSDLLSQTANPSSQAEKNERFGLMLDRAQMYITVASAAQDGSYEFGRAYQILEELVGEAGELSGYGLSGFLMLARVTTLTETYDEAVAFADFVLKSVLPLPDDQEEAGWNTLSRDEKIQRWRLAELATQPLVNAYRSMDDLASATTESLHYYNYLKSEAFPLSDAGNAALLAVASALLEADGYVGGAITSGELAWFESETEMSSAGHRGRNARSALDLALSIAQEVNTAYTGKRARLQVDAQKVISNIIERPGVSVSPEILLQAAEGDYNNKEYPRAVSSLKGILAELAKRDEAAQRQYAPHALYYLGQAYSRQGRHLEAAMAFREGVTTWKGDANWDEQLARKYNSSISRVAKAAGNDAALRSLVTEAEGILLSVADNTGDISLSQADRKYGQKDYSAARALYLQVEAGEAVYEKALMKAALCLYHLDDFVNARVEFKRYLEQHVTDPRNKPVGRAATAARLESSALATYYLGSMAFAAENFAEALEYLADFHVKFESQESFSEIALSKVVQAYLASNDLDGAEAAFLDQRALFPSSAQTGASAARIYLALSVKQEKQEQAGNDKLALKFKGQMAEYRSIANDLDSTPSYTNLRIEAELWSQLEEWERMERALRMAVKHFKDDPDPRYDITKSILPDLGLALMKQKRLPEAYEVLDPLIEKDPDSEAGMPGSLTHRWASVVSGWVEGDESNVIEVPGTGGAADLEVATRFFTKLTNAATKWEGPWYQLKFETAYAFYAWSQEDSAKRETTKEILDNLKQRSGDDRLNHITEMTGNDLLRSRFLWLAGKVR